MPPWCQCRIKWPKNRRTILRNGGTPLQVVGRCVDAGADYTAPRCSRADAGSCFIKRTRDAKRQALVVSRPVGVCWTRVCGFRPLGSAPSVRRHHRPHVQRVCAIDRSAAHDLAASRGFNPGATPVPRVELLGRRRQRRTHRAHPAHRAARSARGCGVWPRQKPADCTHTDSGSNPSGAPARSPARRLSAATRITSARHRPWTRSPCLLIRPDSMGRGRAFGIPRRADCSSERIHHVLGAEPLLPQTHQFNQTIVSRSSRTLFNSVHGAISHE